MPQNLGANHPLQTPSTTTTLSSSAGPVNISFSFINDADVLVFLGGTLRTNGTGNDNYTINTAKTQVTFNNTVSGDVIITRKSDLLSKVRTFTAGSSVRAADLNTQFDQVMQLIQDNYELLRGIILNDGNSEITVGRSTTLADDTVATDSLQDSAVSTAKIANDAVNGDKLSHTGVTPGTYTTADITVDAQGRITNAESGTIEAPELEDGSVTSQKIEDGTILNVDISGNAEIAVSKLANGNDNQLLRTNGTDVEWTDNIDIPGTLDVTGGATFDGNLSVAGNTTLTGNLVSNGNITLGNASTDEITLTGRIVSSLLPATDDAQNIGEAGNEWRDLHIDGTANIDTLNADLVNIDGGAIDGTTVGSGTASTGAFTTLSASGNVDFNSGAIDGVTIGGTTAAAGTFTNLVANGNVDLGDAATDSITVTGRLDSDVLPIADDTHDLGSSALKFAEVHATTFTGSVTGNVTGDILSPDGDIVLNNGTGDGTNSTFSGNANTATTLATARAIAGVDFNGGAAINIPLGNLSDVNVGTPGENQDDQVLTWQWDTNTSSGSFGLAAGGGGGSGGLSDVVSDSTPQLGGMLDVNGNSLGDGTLELLSFSETANAVNEFTIANAATGGAPALSATGGDTNIGLNLTPKGSGSVNVTAGTFTVTSGDITSAGDANIDIDPAGTGTITLGAATDITTGTLTVSSGDITAANNTNIDIDPTGNGTITLGAATDVTTGTFTVSGGSITSGNNTNLTLSGGGTGTVVISDNTEIDGDLTLDNSHNLVLQDNDGGGTVTLGVPDDVTTSTTINLPAGAPTATARFLRVSGNGVGAGPHQLEYAQVDTSSSTTTQRLVTPTNALDTAITIAANTNVAMVGPLTLATGQTQTVPTSSTFKII